MHKFFEGLPLSRSTLPDNPQASMDPLAFCSFWNDFTTKDSAPLNDSTFDVLLHLYSRRFYAEELADPVTALSPVLTLIRRAWTTYITAQERLHRSWHYADTHAPGLRHSVAAPPWSLPTYQHVVYQRYDLHSAALPLFLTASECLGIEDAVAAVDGNPAAQSKAGAELRARANREARAWRAVRRRFDCLYEDLGNAVAGYAERAAIEEARAAGGLARAVALFLPLQIIMAIFSTGGAYAFGEERNWIVWLVVLPTEVCTMVLMWWYFGMAERCLVWIRKCFGGWKRTGGAQKGGDEEKGFIESS